MNNQLRTVVIEGGYAEECPPFKIVGENIQQIIRGIEFTYPSMKDKLYQTPWTVITKNKNTKKETPYTAEMFINNTEFNKHNEIHFRPDPDGGFFIAPFILMAIAAAAEAGGAIAIAAGTAGAAMAAGGVAAGVAASGLAGTLGAMAAIGSAVIVMGAMYGLSQAFQPGVPKINSQSAASGGEQPSFLYNNPPNVTEQGNSIPLIYGNTRTGGTVISSALLPYQVQKVKIKA